jgi:hypothetical protein
VFVILAKKASTRLSQYPCFGVYTNSNLFGTVFRYSLVAADV